MFWVSASWKRCLSRTSSIQRYSFDSQTWNPSVIYDIFIVPNSYSKWFSHSCSVALLLLLKNLKCCILATDQPFLSQIWNPLTCLFTRWMEGDDQQEWKWDNIYDRDRPQQMWDDRQWTMDKPSLAVEAATLTSEMHPFVSSQRSCPSCDVIDRYIRASLPKLKLFLTLVLAQP